MHTGIWGDDCVLNQGCWALAGDLEGDAHWELCEDVCLNFSWTSHRGTGYRWIVPVPHSH